MAAVISSGFRPIRSDSAPSGTMIGSMHDLHADDDQQRGVVVDLQES